MIDPRAPAVPRSRTHDRLGLVLASFAMLFAELALIRWVAAYQIYVAYFTNFVLLASFLGIGVGFLRARAPRDLSRYAPFALAGVALLVFAFRVVKVLGPERDIQTIFGLPAPPIWVVLPVIFLGVALAMALVAEGVARLFDRFEPLEAYRLDISGSLLGIVAFSGLSFLRVGPVLWGLVLAGLFLALSPEPLRPRAHPRRAIGAARVDRGVRDGFARTVRYVVPVLSRDGPRCRGDGRIADPRELPAAPVDPAGRRHCSRISTPSRTPISGRHPGPTC